MIFFFEVYQLIINIFLLPYFFIKSFHLVIILIILFEYFSSFIYSYHLYSMSEQISHKFDPSSQHNNLVKSSLSNPSITLSHLFFQIDQIYPISYYDVLKELFEIIHLQFQMYFEDRLFHETMCPFFLQISFASLGCFYSIIELV